MRVTRDSQFTVDDYMALPEGFPAQLIDGGLVREPSPTHWHQRIVIELAMRLREVAGRHRVLVAPADVVIDRFNVYQPDVLVFGPEVRVTPATPHTLIPVFVAEIHSPGTEARERGVKADTYLRAGVAEVWLLDPVAGTIEVRTSAGSVRYGRGEPAVSTAVPGFAVTWSDLVD